MAVWVFDVFVELWILCVYITTNEAVAKEIAEQRRETETIQRRKITFWT